MTLFYRFIRFIVSVVFHIIYRIRVVGEENIPQNGAAIICCNHTSMSDVPFLAAATHRQIFFMGKEELFKNRITRWFFGKLGAFAVSRGSGAAADGIKSAISVIENGGMMGIFPEGTRNRTGKPVKCKAGVALVLSKAPAAVIPAAICRMGLRPFTRVTVRFGKPIENACPADASRPELKRSTALIAEKITELLEMGI